MPHATRRIAFLLCFTFSLALLSNIAQAQSFTVLHAFTGGADGADPLSGVTIGGPGILYGTTYSGGTGENGNGGVAFKLAQRGSGWELEPLYEFSGVGEGYAPLGPVTVRNGALYGTTSEYGGTGSTGTVFELQPPPTACKTSICYWNETILHSFTGAPNDGASPQFTNLVFDQAGNIYGTTQRGGNGSGPFCGSSGCGTVFELSPSGGRWTFSIIHNFQSNGIDGVQPTYGVIFDPAGNLYGTTLYGGNSTQEAGTVFELTPSGGSWAENILYSFFSNSMGAPVDATTLVMDQSGNLYGSTVSGGPHSDGTIYELTPSEGGWNFSTLYTFDGCDPQPLAMDTAGNLYGTCTGGGQYDHGWVFKLTNSGGSWMISDFYDFTGGSGGAFPFGPIVFDSSGNLYGTTTEGGNLADCGGTGCGTVWEIAGVTEGLRR
jgi:uncharacterized repeat protein (TIGR03803 family)